MGAFWQTKRPDIAARPFQFLYRLFCGVGGACSEECRQLADIGLLGTGQIGPAIATRRTAAARTAFTRLAGLAFSTCGLDRRGFFAGHGRLAGSNLAFGALGARLALATFAALMALLAFTFGALAARALLALLLARLLTLGLIIALGLHILLLRLRLWRREAGVHLRHIIIKVGIILPVGALAALRLLGAGDDAEIVLGMLEIILRHHRIAAGLRIARQLQIFLGDMGGIAAHLHVRTVALEIAGQRIDVFASAVPATLPVLVILIIGSHLVALSNSRKISVTLLADRHLAWSGQSGKKLSRFSNRLYLAS
jgi:hypothetical protein